MTIAEAPPPPLSAVPSIPSTGSNATAVEQSRAVAEVHAAVVVAKSCPRSLSEAVAEMRESCAQMALAERAFYRFPRGRETVTGPTIHLARELARCFGNVQYGISELRRDDAGGQSEMVAWAWDVERNTRSAQTFIVPHRRDTRQGQVKLTDLRDIYENNANNGARRVREAIFAILPTWFTEEAKSICAATIEKGVGDKPIAQQIASLIAAFRDRGVTADQLEQKLGRSSDAWTAPDIAQMRVIWQSLQRGEITIDEEFPPARTTSADLGAPIADPPISSAAVTPVAAAEDPASDVGAPGSAPPASEAPPAAEPCIGCGQPVVHSPDVCPGSERLDERLDEEQG